MQRIAVRKHSDIVFYDLDLDMLNFRNKNIDIHDDVLRFFQNHQGMFHLEAIQVEEKVYYSVKNIVDKQPKNNIILKRIL